jgi:hypothetical protein
MEKNVNFYFRMLVMQSCMIEIVFEPSSHEGKSDWISPEKELLSRWTVCHTYWSLLSWIYSCVHNKRNSAKSTFTSKCRAEDCKKRVKKSEKLNHLFLNHVNMSFVHARLNYEEIKVWVHEKKTHISNYIFGL